MLAERNHAAALQSALLHDNSPSWVPGRPSISARYQALNAGGSRREVIEKAPPSRPRAAATGNADVGGIAINTGGMVQPPPGAPPAVAQVIAAGNAIATLPYIYGGGHASFQADGYDCSGSVSYALAAAGLVSSPMVSGEFESWGEPAPAAGSRSTPTPATCG